MVWYILLFLSVILLDRITKCIALYFLIHPWPINNYLSFVLAVNRGVSWGLLHSSNNFVFWMVTSGIILLTLVLAFYAINRFKQNKSILGEVLVIAGSTSNIIDRIFYHGVIDFVLLSYGDWSWPIFNVADMSIVIGVVLMVAQHWKKD